MDRAAPPSPEAHAEAPTHGRPCLQMGLLGCTVGRPGLRGPRPPRESGVSARRRRWGPYGGLRDATVCPPRDPPPGPARPGCRCPRPSALCSRAPSPQSKVEESAWGRPPLRWHSVTAAAMREAGRVRLFFFLLFLLLSGGEASDRAGLVVQAEAGTTLALAGCARAGHSRRDRVASVGPWNRRRPRPPPGPCRGGGPGGAVPSSHACRQRAMAGPARNGPWRCRGLHEDRFSFSCE